MAKKEISSGAEKAEELAHDSAEKQTKSQKTAKGKTGKTAEKTTKTKQPQPRKAESAADKRALQAEKDGEKKLKAARARAEKKQKKLEKKLEHKQKRLERIAAMKDRREERREKRRERRDLLKSETRAQRAERKREERALKAEARAAKRKAAAEERTAKREHRLRIKQEKRESRAQRQHAPGFGGWLAAVISLGVTTLALGTIVAFGWMNVNGMQARMADSQYSTLYELNSVVDNLDGNLAKARIATSGTEQTKLLSDIAVESEIAEALLSRMPVECRMTESMTSFINKMSDSAKEMLYSVAAGGKLTDSQTAAIEYMYRTNLEMKRELNELTSTSCAKDMIDAMTGKQGLMYDSFENIRNNAVETPKEIQDGPFAESNDKASAKYLENEEDITSSDAEKLAEKYFADYGVTKAECCGESNFKGAVVYNLNVQTDDGEMFAQLSKQGGKVVMFNSYKDCSDKNFSVERCIDIAEDFLSSIGYNNMTAVWTSENGTACNLNFAFEQDGVIIYPDIIKVKVCEQRGIVTGIEALSYVLNHTDRTLPEAGIDKDAALAAINEKFDVAGSRLALIPFNGEEALTYEIYGNYGDAQYYLYIDAATGEQIETLTVVGTKQGRALM